VAILFCLKLATSVRTLKPAFEKIRQAGKKTI